MRSNVAFAAFALFGGALLSGVPRAETGIDGEDYIVPEISNAIQRRCALKFPFDVALVRKCNYDQSRAYWRFLGYLEIGKKMEPFGLSVKASNALAAVFWSCYYKYGTDSSPDFVNTNKCNEKRYIELFKEKPVFENKPTVD